MLGVEYEAYAKITGLLTVYGSSVGVDARYAPEALLSVLAGGQQDVARQVLLSREGGELDTNLMAMDQALIVRGNDATAYRIDISVTLDGTSYVRRAWYEQGGGGANNEPWWTRVQEPGSRGGRVRHASARRAVSRRAAMTAALHGAVLVLLGFAALTTNLQTSVAPSATPIWRS